MLLLTAERKLKTVTKNGPLLRVKAFHVCSVTRYGDSLPACSVAAASDVEQTHLCGVKSPTTVTQFKRNDNKNILHSEF